MPRIDQPLLHGIVPIVPTPFTADETIDFVALDACVRFAIGAEASGICLPAYGSEFYKLSDAERLAVIERAIAAARGRIPVIAQSNHPSSRVAADLAGRHEQMGAAAISFALPRQFALSDDDLLNYARPICDATRLPVLIQDFNPTGAAVGPTFAERLHRLCPNFQFLKLEESLLGSHIRDIIRETGGEVGVLAGWGGLYTMELIPEGICGIMPGLSVTDLLLAVWQAMYGGRPAYAMDLFQEILPQLAFSLQNLEFWLFVDKKFLVARGVIPESSSFLRLASRAPIATAVRHALMLNERLLRVLDRIQQPRNPSVED